MSLVLGYITCEDADEAGKIAKELLNKKLIACANIIEEINSLYWWKRKIEDNIEALLLVKSEESKIKKIIEKVKKIHSYDVPCIEFIQIKKCNTEYEKWIKGELK